MAAPKLQEFILTAANKPERMAEPQWHRNYHGQILELGFNARKSRQGQSDYLLCLDFWTKEWPAMDTETRANGMATVMNTLHVFNAGMVKEMLSDITNCSPARSLEEFIARNTRRVPVEAVEPELDPVPASSIPRRGKRRAVGFVFLPPKSR